MARPTFEFVPTGPSRSFIYKIDRDIWPVYHFHPEIDILLVLKNHGEYISGDRIGRLEPGTLIMNGPNIPHALHPRETDEEDWSRPSLVVLQFSAESLGEELLARAEMNAVRQFLEEASRGFEFFGKTRRDAESILLEMEKQDEFERLLSVWRLLQRLARDPEDREPMASSAYAPSLREASIDRIDRVIRHLQKHKAESIELAAVADLAGMSPKSFSRFFKQYTGKTLIRYVNELRVGEACKRLLETREPVTEIAYEVGFNNLSNFNRRFRELKGMSPREFRAGSDMESRDPRTPLPASREPV